MLSSQLRLSLHDEVFIDNFAGGGGASTGIERALRRPVDRYVLRSKRPFIVELTHQGNAGVASVDEPVKTLTAAHRGEKALGTITATKRGQHAGCTCLPYYGSEDEGCSVNEPARTVTTRDRFGVAPCIGAPYPLSPDQLAGARRVAAFLREHGVQFEGELATVTVHGETYVIVDIGMRMLKPRELYLAQGFPRNYIIDRGLDEDEHGRAFAIALTGTEQVRMVGNSVAPPMAEALVGANNPEMRVENMAA